MAQLVTDCEGRGVLQRTEAEDHRKRLEFFPCLCDRCGGTGKIAKPKPSTESS